MRQRSTVDESVSGFWWNELEREIRNPRKLILEDAIARMAGPGTCHHHFRMGSIAYQPGPAVTTNKIPAK
jgi:hypothetical protein